MATSGSRECMVLTSATPTSPSKCKSNPIGKIVRISPDHKFRRETGDVSMRDEKIVVQPPFRKKRTIRNERLTSITLPFPTATRIEWRRDGFSHTAAERHSRAEVPEGLKVFDQFTS